MAFWTAERPSLQSQAPDLGFVARQRQIPKGLEVLQPCENVLGQLVTQPPRVYDDILNADHSNPETRAFLVASVQTHEASLLQPTFNMPDNLRIYGDAIGP